MGAWRRWREKDVRYSELKKTLSVIIKHVKSLEGSQRKEAVEKLKKIYARIGDEWHRARIDTTTRGMIGASDLLEAYNTIFDKESNELDLQLRRLSLAPSEGSRLVTRAVQRPFQAIASTSQKAILLADYQQLGQIVRAVESADKPLTRSEIGELIAAGHLQVEQVPAGKMIDALYRHRFKGRFQIEKTLTKISGWLHASSKLHDVRNTMKFFRGLHVDLWMEIGGGVYSFSELFGYELREAKSHNASFKRALTDEARDQILAQSGYLAERSKVQDKLKDPSAQVVCANAFSRVTVQTFHEQEIDAPRTIREKVLSPSPENAAISEKWGSKSFFTIHDMLGGFPLIEDGSQSVELVGQRQPSVDDAQRQASLLAATTSMVKKRRGMMVIQRLSPSDIHHFYSTADGHVLTRAEWCGALHGMIEERRKLGVESETDGAELAQLEQLQEYFAEKKDEQPTINIAGSTLSSVNTLALRHQPSILATNDRKIMMVRHADGCLALHVFVGASAVNQVDVRAPAGEVQVMRSLGAMGFGSAERGDWITARVPEHVRSFSPLKPTLAEKALHDVRQCEESKKRRDKEGVAIPEVGPDRGIVAGPQGGSFGAGGSTVISLYFGYRPIDPLERVPSRETKEGKKEVMEILCRPGNVLATPMLNRTLELMESLGVTPASQSPLETLRLFHNKLKTEENLSPLAKEWLQMLQAVDPGSLASEEGVFEAVAGYENRRCLRDLIEFLKKEPF
jgi:phosphatidylserine decarboxylase